MKQLIHTDLISIYDLNSGSIDKPIPFALSNCNFHGMMLGTPNLIAEFIPNSKCIKSKKWIDTNLFDTRMDLICGDPFILRNMILKDTINLQGRLYWVFQQEESEAYFLVNKIYDYCVEKFN